MPVKLLNLDDRTFADLVDEMRLLIPRHARPWTDHNYSDPGIMLAELFAWLTEAMLYRLNRVPDASRVRLLELLGAIFRPAEPTVLELRVAFGGESTYTLHQYARVRFDRGSDRPVYFEVLHDVSFTPQQPVRTVTARQTQPVASHALLQKSNGKALQLWPLDSGFLVAPPEPRPRSPEVFVGGEPWEFRPFLRESAGTDRHFTFKPWLESLVFGDGQHGAIPPQGVDIKLMYRASPTSQRVVKRQFSSDGRPWQHYRLAQQPLPLDLEQPGDLEPQLEVIEPGSPGTLWQYVTRFLDMAPHAAQYTFEPWYNAVRFGDGARTNNAYIQSMTHGEWYNSVRFGDGARGKIPARDAQVKVQYRQTLGAEGMIPLGAEDNSPLRTRFSFWSSPSIEAGQVKGGVVVPEASWHRVTPLEVKTWEILSPGRNPTTLDEARRQVVALLEPGWRSVTADDFVSIVQNNRPEIARAVCLPGYDPAASEPNAGRPGHVGIIVIPRTTHELTAAAAELENIEALAANGLYLVTRDTGGITRLWNLNNRKTTQLGETSPRDLVFSPDSRRLVVVSAAGLANLWDTAHGRRLAALEHPLEANQDRAAPGGTPELAMASSTQVRLRQVLFSPDGQHLVAIYTDDQAYLWASKDGVPLKDLGSVNFAVPPVFSPDGHLLVTAHANTAWLWSVAQDNPPLELQPGAPVTCMTFSPDGSQLAIAATDVPVRLYRIRPQDGQIPEPLVLDAGQSVEALVFDNRGARLVTHGSDGGAALWRVRTGARMASLSAESPVDLLAFSADGGWLATGHRDRSVRCWSTANGQTRFALSLPGQLEALVFSLSGQRLITISAAAHQAHTVQTWDLRGMPGSLTAMRVQEIPGRQPLALHVSGRWLAYADERLVHVWDVESSKDIAALYVDFADANVSMDGWGLVTPQGGAASSAIAVGAPVQLAQTSYLWIVSAVAQATARRSVQVFHAEHLYEADTLLTTRRLVTSQPHLEGPTYTRVDIAVTVMRRTLEISAEKLAANIRTALARFFDPLTGGPDGKGWPLGRAVYASEVYEVVESVAGVDHVEHLKLNDINAGHKVRVEILPRSLVQCQVNAQVA